MRVHAYSSDVLEDMRINVFEEGSDRVVWYKASRRHASA